MGPVSGLRGVDSPALLPSIHLEARTQTHSDWQDWFETAMAHATPPRPRKDRTKMSDYQRCSIGRDKAIELAKTQWWVGLPPWRVAMFQMLTDELCMPFDKFHEAVEQTLGRPVFTREFGLNWDGIMSELTGNKPATTMDEILNLIPKDKRVVVFVKGRK